MSLDPEDPHMGIHKHHMVLVRTRPGPSYCWWCWCGWTFVCSKHGYWNGILKGTIWLHADGTEAFPK